MIGLSSDGKELIAKAIESIFDSIALNFVGDIPKLVEKKRLIVSNEPNYGLAHLFVRAMSNKVPNAIEKDVLKSLLKSSYGYIESLKNKTMANVTERIDGIIREAKLQKRKVTNSEIQDILTEELGKARSNMIAIVESEGTKLRNMGSMMDITRVAASSDDEDPTIFFVVVKDNVTCRECKRIHLMPDEVTPRLFKFSELKQSYHKRGDNSPSAFGLHPYCRCTLTYLVRGFGFNEKGQIQFKELEHDEYSKQRK